MCDLETAQINVWQELRGYVFKLGDNGIEAIKNICPAKSEGVVDHSIVTRCWKKFCLGCKNLNN